MKHILRLAAFLLLAFLLCAQEKGGGRGCARSPEPEIIKPQGEASMPKHIIRVIRTAHCARGPKLCAKCREMDVPKICLLDIDPPNQGREARRTIEVEISGKSEWREFDVIRSFESEAEARKYAAENGIADVDLSP